MGTGSRRACRRSVSVLVALAVATVGCVGPDPLLAGVSARTPAAATCGAASNSCVLPYPSDAWLVPDAGTATGQRLQVPPGSVDPSVLAQLGPRDEAAEAIVGADGFSPLTPVVLQLPPALGDRSVPADGGDVAAMWDLTTGQRIPVRAEVSERLADERGARNIVLIWPRTHLPYGHRIFAGLRGVIAADGAPATPAPSMATATDAVRRAAAQVAPNVPWESWLSATTFTVRSQASITADVDRMAGIVRADDHPVRNIEVRPSFIGGAAVVSGQVRTTDFRESDGVIPRGGTAVGRQQWIDFMAVLPDRPATPAGAPVVMYGHGITVMKETMLVVAAQNAAHGFATIGIDDPNHGSRIGEGGHIVDLAFPALLGRVESLLLQAELDHLSLLRAIQTQLGALDVLPRNWAAGTGGDGVPDLDTTHVLYEGTSLGGVLGATFLGLAPEVEGAFLQVPGGGIIDILWHSVIWEMFKGIVPVGAPYGESHVLTFFAQHLLDRADNTFYLDRIRERGTPIFLSYAIDDGIVPNVTTERMLNLLGLPRVGPQAGPVWAPLSPPAAASMPADGRGYGQVPTGQLYGNLLKPLLSHVEFLNPISVDSLDRWLVDRRAALTPG